MSLPEMSQKKIEGGKRRCRDNAFHVFHCEVCYEAVQRNAMNGRTNWDPQGFLKRMLITSCSCDHRNTCDAGERRDHFKRKFNEEYEKKAFKL